MAAEPWAETRSWLTVNAKSSAGGDDLERKVCDANASNTSNTKCRKSRARGTYIQMKHKTSHVVRVHRHLRGFANSQAVWSMC